MVVVVVVLVSMLVVVLVVGIILLRMHWLLFPLTRSHLECTGDEESLLECSGMFLHLVFIQTLFPVFSFCHVC